MLEEVLREIVKLSTQDEWTKYEGYGDGKFENLYELCQQLASSDSAEDLKSVEELLVEMNKELEGREWFDQDQLTNRDLLFFIAVKGIFCSKLTAEFREQVSALTAWFQRVSTQPVVVEVCGPAEI